MNSRLNESIKGLMLAVRELDMDDIIEDIPKTMEKFMGCSGKMVKPAPRTVEKLIGQIRRGKLTTLVHLREKLAIDFGVETACPAATLKALVAISKQEKPKSYWRVLKPKGELISKFPYGLDHHAEQLEVEGFEIDFSKKTPVVLDYSSKLFMWA